MKNEKINKNKVIPQKLKKNIKTQKKSKNEKMLKFCSYLLKEGKLNTKQRKK